MLEDFLKRELNILKNKQERLEKQEEQLVGLLQKIDIDEEEQHFFEELKKLESIQDQLEIITFEIEEIQDELAEL